MIPSTISHMIIHSLNIGSDDANIVDREHNQTPLWLLNY